MLQKLDIAVTMAVKCMFVRPSAVVCSVHNSTLSSTEDKLDLTVCCYMYLLGYNHTRLDIVHLLET